MARALDLSQLGCPGLSPPCSSWIPCCTPHRSCRLASYSPQLGFGKPTPAPHALLGSQEHSQGTQATWARRVLPGKPCLSGSGPGSPPTSFLLPLRGCIAPASPWPPPGGVPHSRAPPTSGFTGGAPHLHTQGLCCFFMPGPGEREVMGPQTWLYGMPLLHSWPGRHRQHPHFAAGKNRCREVKKLAYSLLTGKQAEQQGLRLAQKPAWTLCLQPRGSGSARPVGQGRGRGCRRGLFEGPGTQRCRGWQGLPVEKLARTKPGQGFLWHGPYPTSAGHRADSWGQAGLSVPCCSQGKRHPLDTCPPPCRL